jgi:hypothetical protein
MREQWDRLLWAISPYNDALRVVVSIVGIVLIAALLRDLGRRLVAPFFGRITQRASTIEERRRLQTVGRIARQALSTPAGVHVAVGKAAHEEGAGPVCATSTH